MKKILSLLLICIMLSCSLAGCGSASGSENEGCIYSGIEFTSIAGRSFMIIDEVGGVGLYNQLLIDIEEKTQYYYIHSGYKASITLLVDSEGKPLLYEGEIPYYGGEVGN